MPGLLAATVNQGYDYLSPYVEKAQPYVEKARNNVPLVDPALKTAEELVPALITRADQLAEPQVEKIRPFVEPKIEQVNKIVTPYVDATYKEGVKYYNVGLEKVEQVKEFKNAKETQIRGFAEPRIEQIKEFTEARTTQIREFADPKVETIKEFTEAKTTQIKKFADPKVEKIKEFVEPKFAAITAKRGKIRTLLRVPGAENLQALNYESVMGKVAAALEKVETLMDKYLPLPDEKKDNDSDTSNVSDTSCVRINRSVLSIVTRPAAFFTVKMMILMSVPMHLKTYYMDGKLKSDIQAKVAGTQALIKNKSRPFISQITDKLAPTVVSTTKAPLFKKVTETAVCGSEKIFGKEKTATILSKVDTYIPAKWKAAPKVAAKSQ